jgi:hypothetical protein
LSRLLTAVVDGQDISRPYRAKVRDRGDLLQYLLRHF